MKSDLLKTKEELTEQLGEIRVEVVLVEKACFNVIAHFGNIPSLKMIFSKEGGRMLSPCPLFNNIANMGYITHVLVELFECWEEDGVDFPDVLVGKFCRLVSTDSGTIAIGHASKDRFILIETLMTLTKEKVFN